MQVSKAQPEARRANKSRILSADFTAKSSAILPVLRPWLAHLAAAASRADRWVRTASNTAAPSAAPGCAKRQAGGGDEEDRFRHIGLRLQQRLVEQREMNKAHASPSGIIAIATVPIFRQVRAIPRPAMIRRSRRRG
jgi:hypothetical protein